MTGVALRCPGRFYTICFLNPPSLPLSRLVRPRRVSAGSLPWETRLFLSERPSVSLSLSLPLSLSPAEDRKGEREREDRIPVIEKDTCIISVWGRHMATSALSHRVGLQVRQINMRYTQRSLSLCLGFGGLTRISCCGYTIFTLQSSTRFDIRTICKGHTSACIIELRCLLN
jgi:hypothetical protein